MKHFWVLTSLVIGLQISSTVVFAQETWTPEQQQVLAAIGRLSDTTAPEGAGADAYGAILSEEFSRWTVGSKVTNDKPSWVEGLREWFDAGWRVSDRETQTIEVRIRDDFAFTRRVVTETYVGPENASSISSAALAEVWVRTADDWLLLLVNVHPLDEQ